MGNGRGQWSSVCRVPLRGVKYFLRPWRVFFLTVFISSCTGYRPVSSFEESGGRAGGPDFFFQAYNFFTEGNLRSDFYVLLTNRALQFTKDGDRYVASYNVNLRIFGDEGTRLVTEKNWTETVTENDYEATTSKTYHVSPRTFSLESGKYTIVVEITDELSQKTMRRSGVLEIPDYRNLFLSLSNVIIGSRFASRNGQEILLPNLGPEMSYAGEQQYASLEVYDKLIGRDVILKYSLYGIGRYETPLFLSPYYPSEAARQLADTLFWTRETTITTSSASVPVRLSLPTLPVGHYRLDLHAASGGQRDVRTSRAFSLWPFGFPEITTTDKQIEVLDHIATLEEFERLKQAQTKEEKQQRLAEFWTQHWNRDEYYKRAEYANRYFSCVSEGWRTPFGWAFMVVGPPEDIQLSARGVERWRYTLSSSRILQLVFDVRELAFGNVRCKYATMSIDPSIRREVILRWKRSE